MPQRAGLAVLVASLELLHARAARVRVDRTIADECLALGAGGAEVAVEREVFGPVSVRYSVAKKSAIKVSVMPNNRQMMASAVKKSLELYIFFVV